jgi:hypothetical protein
MDYTFQLDDFYHNYLQNINIFVHHSQKFIGSAQAVIGYGTRLLEKERSPSNLPAEKRSDSQICGVLTGGINNKLFLFGTKFSDISSIP